jgi:hypothetical protein
MAKPEISRQHDDVKNILQGFKAIAGASLAKGVVDLNDTEVSALANHVSKAEHHLITSAGHHLEGDHFSALSHMMTAEEHINHAHSLFNAGFVAPDFIKEASRDMNAGVKEDLRNAVNSYSWNNPPTPQGKVK